MFQVFSGNISLENINQNIIDDNFFFMNNSAFEIIGNEVYLFNNFYKCLKIFQLNYNNTLSFIKDIYLDNIPNGILKDLLIIKNLSDNYYLMLTNEKGSFCEYNLNIKNKLIEDYYCKNFNEIMIPINKSLNYNLVSISLLNSHYLYIAYTSLEKKNEIIIRPVYFFSLKFPFLLKKITTYNEIENLDFKCFSNKCLLIYKIKELSFLKSYYLKIDNFIIKDYKFKDFGVGKHFSLNVFEKKNKIKFFFVKDESYCYHNEKNNKDAKIFLCDRIEKPMNHVLNYIYGSLELNTNNINDINYSNICSKNSLTGTYDLGDFPKVKIFFENEQFNFIEMHDALRININNIICGMPNFHFGIIADNWNIGDIEL